MMDTKPFKADGGGGGGGVPAAPAPPFEKPPVLTPPAPPTYEPTPPSQQPRIYSKESGIACNDTLFNTLNFEAFSFYNFYVEDELTNDTQGLENRNLDDVPRYVKLVWDPAPNMDNEETVTDSNEQNPMGRSSEAAPVGVKAGVPQSFIVGGLVFSPGQLKPLNFGQIANSLANSDLTPGVMSSVVSLPVNVLNLGTDKFKLDLDAWAMNKRLCKIQPNEFINQLHNMTNEYFYAPEIMQTNMTPEGRSLFANMFSGQFSASPSNFVTQGQNSIVALNSSSPTISQDSTVSETQRPGMTANPLQEIYEQVIQHTPPQQKSSRVSVKFVDLSIGGAVKKDKVNGVSDPSHANSIMGIAQFLPNMIAYSQSGLQNVTRKIYLKSFDCPAGVRRREYVGYIIEKYEQVNGVFEFKEVIGIPDKDTTSYIDTRVKYGAIYRYRIRTILRWVRPRDQQGLTRDQGLTVADLAQEWINRTAHSKTSLTPNLATYFGSEFNKAWAVAYLLDDQPPAPPDQLWIRPDSRDGKKHVVITFQPPYNPQKDIYMTTLYRKVVNSRDPDKSTGWESIAEFDMSQPAFWLDTDVDYYQNNACRYIYAATCRSVHDGESVFSEQLSARLNADVSNSGEFDVQFVSCAGVHRRNSTGAFAINPEQSIEGHLIIKPAIKSLKQDTAMDPARFVWFGQERQGTRVLNGSDYFFRVESLDTGEKVDIPITVSMVTQSPITKTVDSGVYWNPWDNQ